MTEQSASGAGITISWKTLAIPLTVIVVALAGVVGVMALSGDDEAAAQEIGLEPTYSKPRYRGPRWPGYSAGGITVIRAPL